MRRPILRRGRPDAYAVACAVAAVVLAAVVFLNDLGHFNTDIKPEVYLAPWEMVGRYLSSWTASPYLGSANFNVGLVPVLLVLSALRDTGFITYGTERVGAADTAVVVTGGGLGDDAGNQGATVARFAAGLAPHGAGVVLAGRDGAASGTSAVAVTRSDNALNSAMSTVDDVDRESGRITTVLALSALVAGGTPGQYGTGQGASAVTVPQ